jgi:FkbM family methyltransferase
MIINIKPQIIYEVGVGGLNLARSSGYFNMPGVEVYLFDPIKRYVDEINQHIQQIKCKNAQIIQCCLYDYDGKIEIWNNGEAPMIKGLDGPNIKNNDPKTLEQYLISAKGYNKDNQGKTEREESISVDCFKISKFDKGNIDILMVDTEGSEWFILKHMISRPMFIFIEMSTEGYTNPHIDEITEWLNKNNYIKYGQLAADWLLIRKDIADLSQMPNSKLNIEMLPYW